MADSNADTSLRLYGIKNCDTIKKARRWLEEHMVNYQFHDYRQDGVTRDLLLTFINLAGWEALLNTRGTTWRKLSDEQRQEAQRAEGALELMLTQPTIMKRPVLRAGDGRLLVGFSLESYQHFFLGKLNMSCPVLELAHQLIKRPSLSPDDAGCQELMIGRLRSLGFTIEPMPFGDTLNFWAWHGEGPTLVFAGHTDVVPGGNAADWHQAPFEPTLSDGMLYGRGAADMKGSLAAMIVAAERFVTQHPNHHGRLAFLITSDEEAAATNGTVKVVEALMARRERLDYCLVGEPSSQARVGDIVKNGRRGSLTATLT